MILENGMTFVWKYARLLERAIFEYHFCDGSSARIVDILRTYQNADGGFGHALEPDLRAPDSQPLFAEFALQTLYANRLRDMALANRICDFLLAHADLKQGIPTIFPSSQNYPRAPHWSNPAASQPSVDRLAGLVGLVNWQGVLHPWLREAVAVCLQRTAAIEYHDAHTILTAFCLLESLAPAQDVGAFKGRARGA